MENILIYALNKEIYAKLHIRNFFPSLTPCFLALTELILLG